MSQADCSGRLSKVSFGRKKMKRIIQTVVALFVVATMVGAVELGPNHGRSNLNSRVATEIEEAGGGPVCPPDSTGCFTGLWIEPLKVGPGLVCPTGTGCLKEFPASLLQAGPGPVCPPDSTGCLVGLLTERLQAGPGPVCPPDSTGCFRRSESEEPPKVGPGTRLPTGPAVP